MDKSPDFSGLEARVLGQLIHNHPAMQQVVKDVVTYGSAGLSMATDKMDRIAIDSMTSFHNHLGEMQPGEPRIRAFQVENNVVVHSWSGMYGDTVRQQISDLKRQHKRSKFYMLFVGLQRWEQYCGKPPYNNAIARRFKEVHQRAVPGVIHTYRLICPVD